MPVAASRLFILAMLNIFTTPGESSVSAASVKLSAEAQIPPGPTHATEGYPVEGSN